MLGLHLNRFGGASMIAINNHNNGCSCTLSFSVIEEENGGGNNILAAIFSLNKKKKTHKIVEVFELINLKDFKQIDRYCIYLIVLMMQSVYLFI
ncbi:hypothetical protein Avbf_18726 [Armadillidium vulgare]|nr:hypothetical protein Avbf_18726 [Armadillidium vulgare]